MNLGNNYWMVNLVSIESSRKIKGGVCYHIDLINVNSKMPAKTYVESGFGNFRNWRQVIQDKDQGQLLTNLKVSIMNGKFIVSADSKPRQLVVVDKEELATQIAQYWNAQAA